MKSSLPPISQNRFTREQIAASEKMAKEIESGQLVSDLEAENYGKELPQEGEQNPESSAESKMAASSLGGVIEQVSKKMPSEIQSDQNGDVKKTVEENRGDVNKAIEALKQRLVTDAVNQALTKVLENQKTEASKTKEVTEEIAENPSTEAALDPLEQALKDDPNLAQEITEFATEIEDNFKSDPAGAKAAFDKLKNLYENSSPSAEEISAIEDGKDDTALQMLKSALTAILSIDDNDIKAAISQKLLHHFAFVGDALERDNIQAAEKFLESWANLEGDNELDFLEKEKAAIREGFRNIIMPADEIDEIGAVKQEGELNVQKPEKEVEAEQSESKQKEDEDQIELEGKRQLKKKESEELPSGSADLNEEDKNPEKRASAQELKSLLKSSAKPAIRVGAALAIAFLVPGVGPILALGFLVATSPKDKKDKDSKKSLEDHQVGSEADEYLKERDNIKARLEAKAKVAEKETEEDKQETEEDEQENKEDEPETEVGEAAKEVDLKESDLLEKTEEFLKSGLSALEGVDAGKEKDGDEVYSGQIEVELAEEGPSQFTQGEGQEQAAFDPEILKGVIDNLRQAEVSAGEESEVVSAPTAVDGATVGNTTQSR